MFFSLSPDFSTLTFADNKDLKIDRLDLLSLPRLHFWLNEPQIALELIALQLMN